MSDNMAVVLVAGITAAAQMLTAMINKRAIKTSIAPLKEMPQKLAEVHELVNGVAERVAKAHEEGRLAGVAEEQKRQKDEGEP